MRLDSFFCCLTDASVALLQEAKVTNTYAAHNMLFVEGQTPSGIYVLCQGKVKLYTCSEEGKIVILHVARPGEVLGLSAVVSDTVYEVSAEVIETCQVNFVSSKDLKRLMHSHSEISMAVVKHLSRQYHDAYHQVRSLGLSSSVADKLATLLLEWCEDEAPGSRSATLRISFTQEEIAEMIGTSRETVSRLLKDFRERKLISVNGSELLVHDQKSLKAAIGHLRRTRPAL